MDLYYMPLSPPSCAVRLTAKALGIELNLKLVDLLKGEHLTPEYLKVNPQHAVPALDDNGFFLWESRAIMVYLVEKYGKTTSLYPTDPQRRAVVNQRLYFDMGSLYYNFSEYFYPQIFAKAEADPEKLKKLEDTLGFFNTFLEGQRYAAGNFLTVADLTLVTSIATIELSNVDLNKFPNIVKWYKLCKETVPGYDILKDSIESFKTAFVS